MEQEKKPKENKRQKLRKTLIATGIGFGCWYSFIFSYNFRDEYKTDKLILNLINQLRRLYDVEEKKYRGTREIKKRKEAQEVIQLMNLVQSLDVDKNGMIDGDEYTHFVNAFGRTIRTYESSYKNK